MSLQNYPSWELKPRKLNQEEREDPMQVIQEFFNYGHLPQIREQLWDLLKTTVTGNYCRALNGRERSNLIYFYEQLEKLIEAAHIIYNTTKEEDDS